MPSVYTAEQTTFFFSMLTNLAGVMQGTPDEIERFVAGRLDVHIQDAKPRIGGWTRVWGPAVYQAPLSHVADNVMYVVQSAVTPRRLVVAIAGTNTGSAFDILIEDLFVEQQVPWAYGNAPAGARISVGTLLGFAALQCLAPGPEMPGANQRLRAFLERAMTEPADITITGHSLGGTLSQPLALWLADTQATWDPRGQATILCQPSAGLTPGNGDFAAYYDRSLGSRTTRIYNRIDTIPHYWNDGDLARLPGLYAPDIAPDVVIEALVAAARAAGSGGDYTQTNRTTTPLPGTIETSLINPASQAYENYFAQAGYQHVEEYMKLLGVTTSNEALAAARDVFGVPAAMRAAARLRDILRRRQVIT